MRYKEFNPNKVLEDCIPLFWNNGFGSCAINDIVNKTGVNRFSLYQEFENKEGILLKALDLYYSRYAAGRIEMLSRIGNSREIIDSFFTEFIKDENGHPPGCFIIHIATELADSNEDVKAFLNSYLNKIETSVSALLERNEFSEEEVVFYTKHVLGLFCTSMCFCVIQDMDERKFFIENGLNVIFNKKISHGEDLRQVVS